MELFHPHHHHNPHDDRDNPAAPTTGASQSLAEALRVSFRLLAGIMGVVLLFYLLSGVKSVESSQVGIKKVFGRVVDVAGPGLAYTWPFPIGSFNVISTREQELSIDDFWMFETPEQKAKGDLLSREVAYAGLDPARDGALLTGDRNLLHVRLSCKYRVAKPLEYQSHIAASPEDVREVVRSALCHAAIGAAAVQTADGLQRTERAAFAAAVRRETQQELDALGSGIEIVSVLLTDSTWPLGALQAYLEAQNAVSKAEQTRDAARAEAEKELHAAAGASYRKLVGNMGGAGPPAQDQTSQPAQENLIGQYAVAMAGGDQAAAATLLAKIDDVLRGNETGGQAARIIAEAEAYRTATIQRVKGRAERFRELLPAFEKTPQLLLQRLWTDVREAILNAPTTEKFYLTFGPNKTVLRISRDPKVVAEIERILRAKDGEKKR
jgi:regulator of protease activity HflC (stomatin/prohibitin superfamily)